MGCVDTGEIAFTGTGGYTTVAYVPGSANAGRPAIIQHPVTQQIIGAYQNATHLHWISARSDGTGWVDEGPVGVESDMAPAVAYFNDKIHLVYRDKSDEQNALWWMTHSDNTSSWSNPVQIPNTAPSESGPALAVFGDLLYCVYRGPENSLYYLTLDKGNATWSARRYIYGAASTSSPSLVVYKGKLYCPYTPPWD
ncbi:hypothetical protein ACFQZZ_31810 [Nocardia sp. GCM10030253]|uniref:hypothetical protein n=1 Tax=Nocardia sp. GCM10030253 TaxID=3273404 RepID=UPI0036312EC0